MSITKKFQEQHFKRLIDPTVPSTHTVDDVAEKLKSLESSLNESKDKLDVFFKYPHGSKQEKMWLLVQNSVDTYKDVRWTLRKKYNAQHVSNAWLKYYEMYSEYKLFRPGRTYKVFLNAELPGSAICAINHYMKTHSIDYTWIASSYFPEISDSSTTTSATATPLGDSYGLYKKYHDNWAMTTSNSGDMTDIKCVLDLETRFGPSDTNDGFDFYSSDAGIDVSQDASGELTFNEQESLNAKLHLGCGLAGLLLLRRGGSMILKQYTCFRKITIRLILEYSKCFEKFYLCKPLTSRPYNSEIYLVGVNFIGIATQQRQELIDLLTNFESYSGGDESPEGSIDAIYNFARYVFTQQKEFIDENVRFMHKYGINENTINKLKDGIYDYKKKKTIQWEKKYPVEAIEDSQHL
jgi:hypothetical protein